jgi:hypothetical protein
MAIQPEILARLPQQYTRAQLIAKSKQLNAAIERETPKPETPGRPAECNGAMVFPLESGGYFCMNCGGNHE